MKIVSCPCILASFALCTLLPMVSFSQNKPVKTTPVKEQQTKNSTAKKVQTAVANVTYGKYSCTASKYRNGSYEFIPRGSFVLEKSGKYTYNGFEKPSMGTYTVDEKGHLLFEGGYFDGGKAEKIDQPNRYFLMFPSNPDNRWTCTLQ